MDLTHKEKKLINDAWIALHYRADCTSNEYRLNEQARIEKKQRSSLYTARVLIMAETARLYRNPDTKARDLIHISPGIMLGSLYGLDSILRTECYEPDRWMPCTVVELLAKIDDASIAHQAAISRYIDKLHNKIDAECTEGQ